MRGPIRISAPSEFEYGDQNEFFENVISGMRDARKDVRRGEYLRAAQEITTAIWNANYLLWLILDHRLTDKETT